MAVEIRARRVIFLVVSLLAVLGVKVLGSSGVSFEDSGADGSGISSISSASSVDSDCTGVSVGASTGVVDGVDGVIVFLVGVFLGGVTVVITLVMTVGLADGVFFEAESLMTPSHSSPLISVGVVSVGMVGSLGTSSGVFVVSVSVVGASAGSSEVSSAKAGAMIIELTATEPIKIRVKNNLTNFFIIF